MNAGAAFASTNNESWSMSSRATVISAPRRSLPEALYDAITMELFGILQSGPLRPGLVQLVSKVPDPDCKFHAASAS
ncbi:hypothetical protein PP1Y_AT23703 [Novosphingobium sp. PP1Y]|nr:hypothetical protein PP1Y_AT23703 [Novosphingobium sp. PP1Y]